MQRDSDNDGLTDSEEKQLHTHPEEKQTYTTTEQREELLRQLYDYWKTAESQTVAYETIRALGVLRNHDIDDLKDVELTDATDDFDFVHADDGSVAFLALDNQTRTDTWLSNRREVALGGIDPWDPDTDDDGLTDGQEEKWLTKGIATDDTVPDWLRQSTGAPESVGQKIVKARTLNTEPTTPDTDGDGYWDGWIGVYDVGQTDNVVLYREHLQTGSGIEGGEIVEEQAGVHHVTDKEGNDIAPYGTAADIDNDGAKEHSNVYIGELQWGSDPTNKPDQPDPELVLETDFYENATITGLDTLKWERGVEQNYALYGIEVDVIRNETHSEFEDLLYVDASDGISPSELVDIATTHGNVAKADEYLIVTQKPDTDSMFFDENTGGFNFPGRPYQVVFTDTWTGTVNNEVSQQNVTRSFYANGMALVTAQIELHEIGHSFAIGEADDALLDHTMRKGEVYTNDDDDDTLERLAKGNLDRWSIMRRGWSDELLFKHNGRNYYVFTIEELVSIEQ